MILLANVSLYRLLCFFQFSKFRVLVAKGYLLPCSNAFCKESQTRAHLDRFPFPYEFRKFSGSGLGTWSGAHPACEPNDSLCTGKLGKAVYKCIALSDLAY